MKRNERNQQLENILDGVRDGIHFMTWLLDGGDWPLQRSQTRAALQLRPVPVRATPPVVTADESGHVWLDAPRGTEWWR